MAAVTNMCDVVLCRPHSPGLAELPLAQGPLAPRLGPRYAYLHFVCNSGGVGARDLTAQQLVLAPVAGSVTATPQGGNVDLTMSIGSSGGHVVLDTTNAAVSFSSFKIHFSGKVSWLYNLLVGLFKGSIKKAVQSAVQKQLQNAVDTRCVCCACFVCGMMSKAVRSRCYLLCQPQQGPGQDQADGHVGWRQEPSKRQCWRCGHHRRRGLPVSRCVCSSDWRQLLC